MADIVVDAVVRNNVSVLVIPAGRLVTKSGFAEAWQGVLHN